MLLLGHSLYHKTGGRRNIKILFYCYRDSHYKDNTVSLRLIFYVGIPTLWKTVFILKQGQGSAVRRFISYMCQNPGYRVILEYVIMGFLVILLHGGNVYRVSIDILDDQCCVFHTTFCSVMDKITLLILSSCEYSNEFRHWNRNAVMSTKFSSPKVVKLTTCCAASVVDTTKFPFRWFFA